MFKKPRIVIILALVFNAGAYNALADMDYHCLSLCIRNGGKADQCNQQCTYGDNNTLKKPKAKKDPHAQFDDMHVAGQGLIRKQQAIQPTTEKDYRCIADCQKGHMAYGYCQETCLQNDSAVK